MDKELFERLAKEAGMNAYTTLPAKNAIGNSVPIAWLERFAALVAEECAKEAEAAFQPMRDFKGTNLYFERCARVIRAKFPPPEQ